MIDWDIKVPHFGNSEEYVTVKEREKEYLRKKLEELEDEE